MPSARITDQQVSLYMNARKKNTQVLAAAKAGISERSARRIDSAPSLPSQNPRRYWRSRIDPFLNVWDAEIIPLLKSAPNLMAITLLRKLQDDHPGDFPDGTLRTLQRHIRHWRAIEGPAKEVLFPQEHAPGHRGLSDFTAMAELRITIASAPFAHILYHFVLAFSRWEHVEVVQGGESFEALSKGLQNALWQAGGIPQFAQRSDKEGWPAGRFLGGLLEHELAERAKRRLERHRSESHLDLSKTLASFEFAEVPMLSKAHVSALAGGGSWIDKGATVLIFGPPGVGKSHVACGIGHALIDAGYQCQKKTA